MEEVMDWRFLHIWISVPIWWINLAVAQEMSSVFGIHFQIFEELLLFSVCFVLFSCSVVLCFVQFLFFFLSFHYYYFWNRWPPIGFVLGGYALSKPVGWRNSIRPDWCDPTTITVVGIFCADCCRQVFVFLVSKWGSRWGEGMGGALVFFFFFLRFLGFSLVRAV